MDTVATLINKIKNATLARKGSVVISYSKFREAIVRALAKEGYVGAVSVTGAGIAKQLEITLVYQDGESRIKDIERVSHLSRRLYQKSTELRPYWNGYGNYFLSTSKGVMVDHDARKAKVGGEVLFKIR